MSDKVDPLFESQWNAWLKQNDTSAFKALSDDDLRDIVIRDLTNVSNMTVEEYTLYQKWCEIQERYPTHDGLFGKSMVNGDDELMIRSIKDNIWIPESFEDYAKLEPVMIYTKDEELSVTWNCIRTFEIGRAHV